MFLSADLTKRGPGDDFWYQPVGLPAAAGVRVTRQTALAVSALYACVQVLSQDLGKVPCVLYRRKGEGKERATDHPLYKLMHRRPNPAQSPFQFKQMKQWHTCLRGNSYSRIVIAPNGSIERLQPLHPDRMRIEYLAQDGWSYRYKYTQREGGEQIFLPGEVLHMRGLAVDGIEGLSPLEVERESIGEAIAAQAYSARMLANDARPGGWIKHPGNFKTADDRKKFRESWQEAQTGMNRGKVAVLEYGLEYKELGLNNVDLQFIEGRRLKDVDMARIFRVPPHKIGILDKATHSNIEQQAIEYVTDTMNSWFTNWEEELSYQLLTEEEQEEYFFEFLADALMRGDAVMRGQFYMTGIQAGWLTRNEARARENLNPIDGLDKPLQPLNMGVAGEQPPPAPAPAPAPVEDEEEKESEQARRARALELAAAERIVRKEKLQLESLYKRHLGHPEAWRAAVDGFYQQHTPFVAEVMVMSVTGARAYCAAQLAQVMHATDNELAAKRPVILDCVQSFQAAYLVECARADAMPGVVDPVAGALLRLANALANRPAPVIQVTVPERETHVEVQPKRDANDNSPERTTDES